MEARYLSMEGEDIRASTWKGGCLGALEMQSSGCMNTNCTDGGRSASAHC
jgi:hypothetical protein